MWKMNGREPNEKKYFDCPLQIYTASTGTRKAETIYISNGHRCNVVVLALALGINSKKFHCLRILWISTTVTSPIIILWHRKAPAACKHPGELDDCGSYSRRLEAAKMTTAVATCLYRHMCLCSYLGSSFIHSEPNDKEIIRYSSRVPLSFPVARSTMALCEGTTLFCSPLTEGDTKICAQHNCLKPTKPSSLIPLADESKYSD